MIPNITKSTGSGRYLGYDLGTKKDRYQKVQFLGYEGVIVDDALIEELNQNWEDGDEEGFQRFRKYAMQLSNDLDKQFRAQAALNDRPKIKAINISLSYSPLDTDKVNQVVHDEAYDDYVPLRLKMLREFLNKMGYINNQWVAVSHLGTHCAHDHVAINTIGNDGSVINLKYDYVRAQRIAKEVREKYGLSQPDESLQMIAPKAKKALEQACTMDEYKQKLQEHGITLVISNHAQNRKGYGLSYSSGTKVIPGSKLHRSLSYGQVEGTLSRNLAAREKAEAEGKAIENAKNLAEEPETFVIHNGLAATLYSNRPNEEYRDMSIYYEAARSILKFYTWGADIRQESSDEFIENAVKGQIFGTVKFDTRKARFVDEGKTILENPEEVVRFANYDGKALNLFTPEFGEYWRGRIESAKCWEKVKLEIAKKKQSSEPVPALQHLLKQDDAPISAIKPVSKDTPAHQQVIPAPRPLAKPRAIGGVAGKWQGSTDDVNKRAKEDELDGKKKGIRL